MRAKICWELRPGDMLEREMLMPIGKYIKNTRKKAIEIAKKRGLKLGLEYYWDFIMGRIKLYRRDSEINYAINLADKYEPIGIRYTNIVNGQYTKKEYYFK